MYFGATAVGLKTRDAAILATDRRMAYGNFVMSRNAKKIFLLGRIGIAFSGLYGDLRGIYRVIEAEYNYMKLSLGKEPSIYSIAKRLSLILYSYKPMPFMVEVLVAGVDERGPRLYVLDSLGSITEEPYAAVGSGATLALGYLEDIYKEDIGLDEAMEIAYRAVKNAMRRDASTGDGIDVVGITRDRVVERTFKLKLVAEE